MRKTDIKEALIRGGIAPGRAGRLVEEFEAHRDDLIRERLAVGDDASEARGQAAVRLGSPQAFVARVLSEPGLKSLAWRYPWLAYALVPLVGFGVALVLSVAGLLGIGWLIKMLSGSLSAQSAAARWLALIAPLYMCWVAPALAGSLLAVSAVARRARGIWPWLGILAIALVGASTNFDISLPPQVAEAQFAGGIGVHLLPSLETWERVLITGLCALGFWSHARRRLVESLG